MSMAPLAGHKEQRRQIGAAMTRGRLPQLLLLTGPAGVGKQRFGLWIAQRLLCEAPGDEPCGSCRQCRLVLNLAHPDVYWVMPVLRPKASEADKQVAELEEAYGELLEQRRKEPLYAPPEGLAGHFIATSRLLGRKAALRPVEGKARLFLIGYAERLVPQEASPEAANALLKLLEEPAEGTHFVLTAADIENVLPTIRSRAVRMRLGRLADAEVRTFLEAHGGESRSLDRKVSLARGAIGNVVADSAEAGKAGQAALVLLESARAGDGTGWELALKQMPFSARGEFTETLDAMADLLVQATRRNPGSPGLERLSAVPPDRLVAALEKVGEAREMAQGNVNPQLLLAVLNQDLAEIL